MRQRTPNQQPRSSGWRQSEAIIRPAPRAGQTARWRYAASIGWSLHRQTTAGKWSAESTRRHRSSLGFTLSSYLWSVRKTHTYIHSWTKHLELCSLTGYFISMITRPTKVLNNLKVHAISDADQCFSKNLEPLTFTVTCKCFTTNWEALYTVSVMQCYLNSRQGPTGGNNKGKNCNWNKVD